MNYYEVLGLPSRTTATEIEENYKVLREKYHPMVNTAPNAKVYMR